METVVGAMRLRRPYCSWERCQLGTTPVDEALQLPERRKPPDVQQAVVKWPKAVPDETACELFEELTGLPLRAHTAPEATHTVAAGLGVLEVAPSPEAIAARIAAVAVGQVWRPIRGLAIEGAEVPTRPETATGRRPGRKKTRAKRARWTGAGRAANGWRCSRLAEERMVQVLSWHHVQTDEELAAALQQVQAAGLLPEPEVRLCGMGDGAPWIWTPVHRLFPTAVEILDYYHGREPLHQGAALPYGAHPERPQAWYEAALARLLWGEGHGGIWGLPRMNPTDAQAAKEMTTLVRYLQEPPARLDYHLARKGGYPLGRGGMESANKGIWPVRLKRAGAWGYVSHAHQMLALRGAKSHGTFDHVLERSRQQIQKPSDRTPPKKSGMHPEPLGHRIVETFTLATPPTVHPMHSQHALIRGTGILRAAIRVMSQPG